MQAVIDNDVLLKGACYGLLAEILAAVPVEPDKVGVLGEARYVVPATLRKRRLNGDGAVALGSLQQILDQAIRLEPSDSEIGLAAELEYFAQKNALPLDSGESLLCAIVVSRAIARFATGDKRAITSIEAALRAVGKIASLQGKVVCLEQLFLRILDRNGLSRIRAAVCSEASVDKALSNCFSCGLPEPSDTSCREGLQSYVNFLRNSAGRTLCPG